MAARPPTIRTTLQGRYVCNKREVAGSTPASVTLFWGRKRRSFGPFVSAGGARASVCPRTPLFRDVG